jgi:phosphate-selective porin OprO/OprP
MRLTKLGLAMATLFGSGIAIDAMALDLYVDNKTQQIFAEPGPNRTKLGSFERVEDNAGKASLAAQQAEINKIKDDFALKNNELKALDEHVNDPSLGKVRMGETGVKWESADGDFTMQLNGRVQLDSQISMNQAGVSQTGRTNSTNDLADGTSIRRARLSAEGAMFKEFGYKFEYDFTRGAGSTAGGVTDAFMTWNGYQPLTVQVGQFKEPISLEESTSDIQTTFIERNMAMNAFIDNNNVFKMGGALKFAQPRWTAQTAIQTESVGANTSTSIDTSSTNTNGNSNRNNGSGDTGYGLTGRVTGLPWFEDKNHFAHIGAAGSQRYVNINPLATGAGFAAGGSGASFGSALNSNVDRTQILSTGILSTPNGHYSTQAYTRAGAEAAIEYGSASLQGEYLQTQVAGNGFNNNTLDGYYVFGSFFLTGESRNYVTKTGVFDRIKPNRNFSFNSGGLGAWELVTGYDYLDLNSGVIHGGRADTGKVGLNWYPNSRIRVMANFIHVFDLNTAGVGSFNGTNSFARNVQAQSFNGTHPDIFEMRTQLDF